MTAKRGGGNGLVTVRAPYKYEDVDGGGKDIYKYSSHKDLTNSYSEDPSILVLVLFGLPTHPL